MAAAAAARYIIAKFKLKLKKVVKTTRPFRYDLHQIPYDYTVEVRNRFKGLDMIDRVPDELWMEVHDIVQETGIKTIPKMGSIPGLGRSPGAGHGNPLEYSGLENPCGQRSLAGYSPWGCKEPNMTEQLN